MILYNLQRILRQYDQRTVLDIDRLEIEEGVILALLGPNGAGKTTLLRILGFLDLPSGGVMTFRGQPVGASRAAILQLRRQVVLVDQHPIMFSTSVCSNIEFGLKIRKIEKKERVRIVDEVLETVGLMSYKWARAHELSGGETQRLALARALALSPAVLLCDEPTASVDTENQEIIVATLQQINEERGTTIIFTTHDRLQAASLAHHTLVLENGRPAPSTYENSFACTFQPGQDGEPHCLLRDRVAIPLGPHPLDFRPGIRGRVFIDPEKITLERPDNQRHQNQGLTGTIILIMTEGDKIRLMINIGVPLVVFMDHRSYQILRPSAGETIGVFIDVDAVTLLAASSPRGYDSG